MNDLNCLPESIHQYTKYEMDNYDRSYLSFIPSDIQILHDGKISMDIMKLNDKFVDEDEKSLYSPDGYEFYFPHPIQKKTCDNLAMDLHFFNFIHLDHNSNDSFNEMEFLDGGRLLKRSSILNTSLNWKKKIFYNESVYVIHSTIEKYIEYNKKMDRKIL